MSIFAQQIHPIERKQEQCLDADSNQTSFGMIRCAEIARKNWDIELNKNY